MRWGLAALVILVLAAAGCVSLGEEGTLTVEEPIVPDGLFLTYEITQGADASTGTFLVDHEDGYTLSRYNASPDLRSPFLSLDETLSPVGYAWDDLFQFPLEPGDTYAATAAATHATVDIQATTFILDGDEQAALEATVTDDDETLATFTLLQEPTVLAQISITREDGVPEAWTLTNATHEPRWNHPPTWEKGAWWGYNATTHSQHADMTLIYNEDTTNTQGTPQRVLNTQHAESRVASTPFNLLRSSDIAPQAGMLNNVLATFWDWPLEDGETFTGSSAIAEAYLAEVALEEIILPDGQATMAFVVTASDIEDPASEPFASWTYAPHTGFLTEFWVHDPDEDDPQFDWELTDWGDGFHGEIEVPQLVPVHEIDHTRGPVDRSDTFTVQDRSDRLRVSGWFVHADTPPKMTLTLEDPDGEVRWEVNETAFRDQLHQTEDVVRPIEPGEWTLTLDIEEGITFFLDIQEVWIETRDVDYR